MPPAKPAPKRRLIPSFGADGQRDRWYSVEACLHYEALAKVTLKRNRRGVILAMLFCDADGGTSLRATMHPGQRYSHMGHVGEERLWQHREIETGRAEFQAVTLGATTTKFSKEETT